MIFLSELQASLWSRIIKKKNYLFGVYEVFKISLKEINVSIIPFFYFNGCLWFFWEGYHSVYVKKAHGLPTKDEA